MCESPPRVLSTLGHPAQHVSRGCLSSTAAVPLCPLCCPLMWGWALLTHDVGELLMSLPAQQVQGSLEAVRLCHNCECEVNKVYIN